MTKFTALELSIIIPVLNEEKLIGSTLDYLLSCILGNAVEILVIDGGSTDQTPQIVQSKNVNFHSLKISCRAKQMNYGASLAKSPVLYFLHADALPPKQFISDILIHIQQGYQLGGYRLQLGTKEHGMTRLNSFFTRLNFLLFQGGGDQSMYILKEVFKALGGFDENYVIMEDFEFIQRARKKGCRHIIMNKVIKVSDRKYQANSYVKVQIANLLAYSAFSLGVSPVKIKSMYGALLKLG